MKSTLLTYTALMVSATFAAGHLGSHSHQTHRHIASRAENVTGSCGDVGIMFGFGLDGNPALTYKPTNQVDFPHGAAPNITTIADFFCNRLKSPCNAPASTVSKCYQAEAAVAPLNGSNAAVAWNTTWGLPVNGTNPLLNAAATKTANIVSAAMVISLVAALQAVTAY